MKNSFFSKFTPKEPKFYPLLKNLAEVSYKGAEQLAVFIKSNHSEGSEIIYQNIKDLEHQGDRITNTIFEELNTTFITPFDREDIVTLANRLDDVMDEIYSCVKRISFYKPKKLPVAASELADLIVDSTQYVLKAVDDIDVLKKNPETIKQYCNILHEIESKADEVYQKFIIELFETEKDPVELIKLKEVINVLESITDNTDHVGKVIKMIIVKYA
ncbi:MAG: DUF47 family protein [Paludibacter sp.]|jgi:predicted phosphate transport protein (TIGR00153 family)|nr:DUF47 family protein [Paludibacter sp.]